MERTNLFQRKGKEPHLALAKGREQEKMVRNHQDEQTHRKFKVSVGIAGKQVINFEGLLEKPWQMATATESRTVKFSWKGK